jgi:uncharacterized membrane protein YqjE
MSLLDPSEPRPQMPPFGTIVRLVNDALGNRVDLAALEMEETRAEAGFAAVLLGIALCLVLFAGFAFTLMVAALVWESAHRGAWLGGLCGAYALAATITGLILRRRWQSWRPFAETKSQIQQDGQCLRSLAQTIFP